MLNATRELNSYQAAQSVLSRRRSVSRGPRNNITCVRFSFSALQQQLRNQTGPSGLVTRTYAGTVVAVEIFKEQDMVPPCRICLKLFRLAIDWSATIIV